MFPGFVVAVGYADWVGAHGGYHFVHKGQRQVHVYADLRRGAFTRSHVWVESVIDAEAETLCTLHLNAVSAVHHFHIFIATHDFEVDPLGQ